MIRRRFLAFLALAPVVLPMALKAMVALPQAASPLLSRNPIFSGKLGVWKGIIFSGKLGVWKGIIVRERSFDYANRTGFAIGSVWEAPTRGGNGAQGSDGGVFLADGPVHTVVADPGVRSTA